VCNPLGQQYTCVITESSAQSDSTEGEGDSDGDTPPWLPRIVSFLAGLPEAKRKRRRIVVIQAFLDDSGVIGTHPLFVMAGFIGRADVWARFADEWQRWLDAPPRIAYLKMNEAARACGQFRSWEDDKIKQKLRGFVEIIKRFPPQKAIHVTIDLKIFEEKWIPHLVPPADHPFFMACLSMMTLVAHDQLEKANREKIEVIFDRQVIFEPRLRIWYPLIRTSLVRDNSQLSILPTHPRFEDDKEYPPLQSADVLAWLFRTAGSGEVTGMEWIGQELESVIPLSDQAARLTDQPIEGVAKHSNKQLPPEVVREIEEAIGLGEFRRWWKKKNRPVKGKQ
jgi:Protein of unknown function (DUF3800)